MNNSFYYSDDEIEEEDIEVIFDDSDDNFSITDDLNELTLTQDTVSEHGNNEKHALSIELDEYISKNLEMAHRKSNNNNEYMLFSNKEHFVLYQLSHLNDMLNATTKAYVFDCLYAGNTSLEEYKTKLLNVLSTNQWSIDSCKEISENEAEFNELGLSNDLEISTDIKDGIYTCPICYEEIDDFNKTPILKVNSCQDQSHHACIDCYKMYLKASSTSMSDSFHIKCIGGSCKKNISYLSIQKILGDEYLDDLLKYSLLDCLNNTNNLQISDCPQADCENVILTNQAGTLLEDNVNSSENVTCLQWHKFCLNCKREVHSPIPCSLLKTWMNKLDEGNESLNWVFNNTQPCPSCDVDIEKMEGCNHVKCGVCKFEFCWICHKDWKTHGGSFYDCMHKRDLQNNNNNSSRKDSISLDRFRNYYKFFLESENNMLLDMRLFNKLLDKKLDKLSSVFGLSLIELEFLTDCVREVVQARNMIKYSFALLYFMDQSHNLFHIFTHNQMLLLEKIDEVSDLLIEANLDSNLTNSKTDIRIIQMKPYLQRNTSMLKKLELTVNKCALDLIKNKIEIYK